MTGLELIRHRAAGRRAFPHADLWLAAMGAADIAIELAEKLEASNARLIAERNLLCNSVTVVTDVVDPGGLSCSAVFADADDEALVAEFDDLIEANQEILARVRGTAKEGAA